METRRLIFITIVSLVLHGATYSQDKPTSILFDQFGKITCEDFLARLEVLIHNLRRNNPTTNGVIEVFREDGTRHHYVFENWAQEHLKDWNFVNRIKIVHTTAERHFKRSKKKSDRSFKIRFWVLPKGSDSPLFEVEPWDYKLYKDGRPYIFSSTYSQSWICGTNLQLDQLVKGLKIDPRSRTNIVIKERAVSKFNKERRRILAILVDKFKVNRKRIKFFFVRENKKFPKDYAIEQFYPNVEVWYLPNRR